MSTEIPETRSATVIPILGMHRSGTSMIARALNLLGLELGGPLLEPNPDNPDGYWEHPYFIRTNAEILHSLSRNPDGFGTYRELIAIPGLLERLVTERDKKAQIARFLGENFRSPLWGWKDPRTVLTFGLWRKLLGEFGYRDVRPVIIVRHPGDVVRSLLRRGARQLGIVSQPEPTSSQLRIAALEIWKASNTILLALAREMPCQVGLYESLTGRGSASEDLLRLARFCGLDENRIPEAARSIQFRDQRPAAGEACEPETRFLEETGFLQAALQLYEQLADLAGGRRCSGELVSVPPQSRPETRTVVRLEDDPPDTPPGPAHLLRQASSLKERGEIKQAIDCWRSILTKRPDLIAARIPLAYALMETGHITEALQIADEVLQRNPDVADAHNLKGFGLAEQGKIEAALAAFGEAQRRCPANNRLLSNMLFASLYSDHLDARAITDLHSDLGRKIEQNAAATIMAERRSARKAVNRPLRIGYLSADFRKHPVGYFLRPILGAHNPRQVESFCYHTMRGGDEMTGMLKQLTPNWREGGTLSDEQLADQIAADGIDILVDLSGHTAANRSGVLARRPAPVQCLYLGYPCTSGLPSVDVLIVDDWLVPPEHEHLYTERIVRLPGSFLCFHPHEDAPAVANPPCIENGFVTFGSFNHLSKISRASVDLWSQILRQVEQSRLVLKALALTDPGTREHYRQQFAANGIDPSRLELLPPTVPLSSFLDEYRRIDIALDPIPYNGGTTTCEALWMGVPVITLPGEHFFSRMGLSLLNTAGLAEFIANSPDDYVRLAVELADDRGRRKKMRYALRQQIASSRLCDAVRFTTDLEALYRQIWVQSIQHSPDATTVSHPARDHRKLS